jgi:hypothetical protein
MRGSDDNHSHKSQGTMTVNSLVTTLLLLSIKYLILIVIVIVIVYLVLEHNMIDMLQVSRVKELEPEISPQHTPCLSRELTLPGFKEDNVRHFPRFNFTSRKTLAQQVVFWDFFFSFAHLTSFLGRLFLNSKSWL